MNRKQKLELTWIGKEHRPKLEPRILIEDPEKSYHAAHRVTEHDIFDNRLIFGDNLLALKALEQEFTGKVKCVFIDPPYNTGSAFEHFDDGLEHSIWLSMMRERLELLRRLLTDDGSIWITIDDNEAHYLKILCDEIFGRRNFVGSMVWEKDSGRKNDTDLSSSHDYVLLFANLGAGRSGAILGISWSAPRSNWSDTRIQTTTLAGLGDRGQTVRPRAAERVSFTQSLCLPAES
jgi:adenine-specific DNA-methyltransferase